MNANEKINSIIKCLENKGMVSLQLPDTVNHFVNKLDPTNLCMFMMSLKDANFKTTEEFERLMNNYKIVNIEKTVTMVAKQQIPIPVQSKQRSKSENVFEPFIGVQRTKISNQHKPQDISNPHGNQQAKNNSELCQKNTNSIEQNKKSTTAVEGITNKVSEHISIINPPISIDTTIEKTNTTIVSSLSNDTVTEHTASLWKYIPIPQDEPEAHTEYDVKKIDLSFGSIIGARVRGKKHKHEGTNCDDWFEIGNIDDWVLITVSDGAGSKKYSRIGARESCEASMNYMKENFAIIKTTSPEIIESIALPFSEEAFARTCGTLASIVQNSIICAYSSVEKAFETRKNDDSFSTPLGRELSFKDFSATMLVAVSIPVIVDGVKEFLIISCQIGDGMIVSYDVDSSYEKVLKLLGEADGGGFAGETDFLTSEQMKQIETLMKRTKIGRRPISCLMVMTDGVSDDYYPNDPQMLRLYLDLKLNGIIGYDHKTTVANNNIELIKKVPMPVSYPWVNDSTKHVSLQYSDKLITATELSLERIWSNKDAISVASLNTLGTPLSGNGNKAEALKVWLDNYVERGSFDDRTLVIFHVK